MVEIRTFWVVLGIGLGLYLLYKLMLGKSKFEEEYDRMYDEVLTADEYKVKGQYDR